MVAGWAKNPVPGGGDPVSAARSDIGKGDCDRNLAVTVALDFARADFLRRGGRAARRIDANHQRGEIIVERLVEQIRDPGSASDSGARLAIDDLACDGQKRRSPCRRVRNRDRPGTRRNRSRQRRPACH